MEETGGKNHGQRRPAYKKSRSSGNSPPQPPPPPAEAAAEQEEEKMEEFFALVRKFREEKEKRKNDLITQEIGKKKKKKMTEGKSWVPEFRPEDFAAVVELRSCVNLSTAAAAITAVGGGEGGEKSAELDLRLGL